MGIVQACAATPLERLRRLRHRHAINESVTVEEAREKLSRGLYVLIREATNARNLEALLPLITQQNSRRICFCTDDRQPHDLLSDGGIDHMLRRAIESGVDPMHGVSSLLHVEHGWKWFGLT